MPYRMLISTRSTQSRDQSGENTRRSLLQGIFSHYTPVLLFTMYPRSQNLVQIVVKTCQNMSKPVWEGYGNTTSCVNLYQICAKACLERRDHEKVLTRSCRAVTIRTQRDYLSLILSVVHNSFIKLQSSSSRCIHDLKNLHQIVARSISALVMTFLRSIRSNHDLLQPQLRFRHDLILPRPSHACFCHV